FGGTVTIDDVEAGQTSAAFGGTTCHVDFVIQPQGRTFTAALEEWQSKATGKQLIDMGYHMAVTDLREGGTLEELATLPEQGVTEADFEGAKYGYWPPVRHKSNWDVLWNAVRTDVLSVISTDHCAFLWDGQKTLGKDDFSKIPNGGPGLENRLQMIHEFGVRAGRISLNRMVELLCTNPAKLFGLYPRKGTIAVGSDADIVVFDPEKQLTI